MSKNKDLPMIPGDKFEEYFSEVIDISIFAQRCEKLLFYVYKNAALTYRIPDLDLRFLVEDAVALAPTIESFIDFIGNNLDTNK